MISKGSGGGGNRILMSSSESPLKKKSNLIVEESKEEGISKVNRTENVKNAAEVTLLYSSKSEKPVEIKG
jgi:hypothetical protein